MYIYICIWGGKIVILIPQYFSLLYLIITIFFFTHRPLKSDKIKLWENLLLNFSFWKFLLTDDSREFRCEVFFFTLNFIFFFPYIKSNLIYLKKKKNLFLNYFQASISFFFLEKLQSFFKKNHSHLLKIPYKLHSCYLS